MIQPFAGFTHFTTDHCVTGSMRHIYHFNSYPISEDLLLGLGSGVGFIYWHMRGSLPFLGGRANAGRPGEEGMEKAAGRRTGVKVELIRTDSPARAEKALIKELSAGRPVQLMVDMGFLPYFDFGEEYHFGYHVVVACGYDPAAGQVLIADREEALYPVALADLAKARGSTFQPFPPHHGWYSFDFSQAHPPESEEIRAAIHEGAARMVAPPISNLGVRGIRQAAERIRKWPQDLSEKELRDTCINTAIMIDARGGTGGGLFRYMYARFLDEAAAMLDAPVLSETAGKIKAAGDCWQEVAALIEQAWTSETPAKDLNAAAALLPVLAEMEEQAWKELVQLA